METAILVTAIINLVMVILLLFTCRFIPRWSGGRRMMKSGGYSPLYKYHSYLWWVFVPSFVIHATLATIHVLSGG